MNRVPACISAGYGDVESEQPSRRRFRPGRERRSEAIPPRQFPHHPRRGRRPVSRSRHFSPIRTRIPKSLFRPAIPNESRTASRRGRSAGIRHPTGSGSLSMGSANPVQPPRASGDRRLLSRRAGLLQHLRRTTVLPSIRPEDPQGNGRRRLDWTGGGLPLQRRNVLRSERCRRGGGLHPRTRGFHPPPHRRRNPRPPTDRRTSILTNLGQRVTYLSAVRYELSTASSLRLNSQRPGYDISSGLHIDHIGSKSPSVRKKARRP